MARLASSKRLELLDLLAQGERDVASLATAVNLGVTTAAAHLQTLRQANLVTTRRAGTRIRYRLADRDVVLAHDTVRLLASHGRGASRLADGMLEWRLAGLPVAVP